MSWKKARLKEVLQRVDRSEEVVAGSAYEILGVRWYGLGAYSRGEVMGEATTYPRLAAAKLGDVIINKIWTRKGSIAVIDEATQGLYCSPEFPLFEIDQTNAIPAWIKYVTQQPEFWLECENASPGTSGKNRITPERFLDISIPLPPLPVQRWIADALSSVDEWIEVSEAEAQTLAGLFDLVKDKAHSDGTPEALGKIAEVKIGPFGTRLHAKDYTNSGIPVVMPKNITDFQINLSECSLISEEMYQNLSEYSLKTGDIIFSRRGDLSKIAAYSSDSTGIIGTGCIRVRFNDPSVAEYAKFAISSARTIQMLNKNAVGSTMPNINVGIVSRLSFNIPSPEKRHTYSNLFQEIQDESMHSRHKLDYMKNLRQNLLHLLLSGSLQPKAGWEAVIRQSAQAAAP